MFPNSIVLAFASVLSLSSKASAAPGFSNVFDPAIYYDIDKRNDLDKRWFTINPSGNTGWKPWPDHKLKYKFANPDSKNQLGSIVTAGWKLWTDAGVDTANIDIIESTDDDALTITVVSDAKAQTSTLSSYAFSILLLAC